MKLPITVIVPTKNEEKNLRNCLECLIDFEEIIVVDSQSTDNTVQIANLFEVKVVDFIWDGKFPKKRNWALDNIEIKTDWVLFVDADEYLTRNFIEELQEKILKTQHTGFWLSYNNFFMGKLLKFGDKMKKLALFKKSDGRYEFIEEDSWSHLDMEIHEHPILRGTIGSIKSPIIHKDYKGLEHYVTKHNAYSTWEANRLFKLNDNSWKQLNNRQKLKYTLLKVGVLPTFYFLVSYIWKLGFLDGKEGLNLIRMKVNYFRQIQLKYKELSEY